MADDLTNLEKLARAATPGGPWAAIKASGDYLCTAPPEASDSKLLARFYHSEPGIDTAPLARYIAALSPDVLLRLLERLRRAEGERDRLREALEATHD